MAVYAVSVAALGRCAGPRGGRHTRVGFRGSFSHQCSNQVSTKESTHLSEQLGPHSALLRHYPGHRLMASSLEEDKDQSVLC